MDITNSFEERRMDTNTILYDRNNKIQLRIDREKFEAAI